MAYIDAVIFTKYVEEVQNGETVNVPNAISDIFAWARANNEQLPDGTFGRYEDLTGCANVHQAILDNLSIMCAKLEVTVATAQQFASDPRIWALGRWVKDDEGEVTNSNWQTTLTSAERTQAINYITSNSAITAGQLATAFDASDTRAQIANKLKAFFRNQEV